MKETERNDSNLLAKLADLEARQEKLREGGRALYEETQALDARIATLREHLIAADILVISPYQLHNKEQVHES